MYRSIVLFIILYITIVNAQSYPSIERASCLNKPKLEGYEERDHANIALINYATSDIHSYIVSILLDEVIGVQNNLVVTDASSMWPEIAAGRIHASMEYWPSTRVAEEQQYFYEQRSVIPAGPVGIIGSTGWFVPRYVLDDVPTALAADFSNPDVAAYFNYTFTVGDASWSGPEKTIIKENNFSLNVEILSGPVEFANLLADRYAKKQPLLFFMWKPNPLLSMFDLVRIMLPNNAQDYYPAEILSKLMWSEFDEELPEAAYLVQSYSMNTAEIQAMIDEMVLNGTSAAELACRWIQNNEEKWQNWISPSTFDAVEFDMQLAMWIICAFCILCALFYIIIVVRFRRSKVIIASSGMFLISMCVGGLLMFGSVAAIASNTTIGCNLFVWLLPTGFALLFGSLFAKTGRIYLLFSNKSLQIIKYTDRDVALCVAVVLVGELVILSVMTGLQPAEFVFQHQELIEYTFCRFHEATGYTLLAYNGLIIIFGIIIAVLVSKLRLTLYNESKYIALSMYNFAFVVIFVVVIFLVDDAPVRFALLCLCILFIGLVSLSILFIPKIILLFRYNEEQLQEMNESQLQAVIRSYTKKFASSSDQKTSTNKGGNSSYKSQAGSATEDEMASLASSVKGMSHQIDELKKENKRLRETTPNEYRDLYEKYYHENMVLKNRIFEVEGRLKKLEQMPLTTNAENRLFCSQTQMGDILATLFQQITIKSKDDQDNLAKLLKSKFLLPTWAFKHVDSHTRNQVIQLIDSFQNNLQPQEQSIPIPEKEGQKFSSSFQKKMEKLYCLKKGWLGDEEGEAMEAKILSTSLLLISEVKNLTETSFVEPEVGPTATGGLEIEWEAFNITCMLREDLTCCIIELPEKIDATRIGDSAIEWDLKEENIKAAIVYISNAILNRK